MYSTRSQMALDIPLQKTNTMEESSTWSKINLSIKNVKSMASFMDAHKNTLFHPQT